MIHIIFLYSNKRKVFYPQLLFFNLKKQGFPRFFQQQQSLRGSQQQLLLSPKRLITIITAMAIHTQSQLPPKIPPPFEQQQLLCITKNLLHSTDTIPYYEEGLFFVKSFRCKYCSLPLQVKCHFLQGVHYEP